MRRLITAVSLTAVVLGLAASPAAAQHSAAILGTWKFDLKQGKKEGPRTIIVRSDSSASYGDETVRWRFKGDSIAILLGGEWTVYGLAMKGRNSMVLSGGDLVDPIEFRKVGPPTPRPDSIPVPADPGG